MCVVIYLHIFFQYFFHVLVNHIALFRFKSYCLEDYILIIFYSLMLVFPSLPLCFFVQLFIHVLDLFSSYRPFPLSLSLSLFKNSTFHAALFLFNFYPHFFIFFHLIPAQNPPNHPRYFPQLFIFLLFLIFLLLFISSFSSSSSLSFVSIIIFSSLCFSSFHILPLHLTYHLPSISLFIFLVILFILIISSSSSSSSSALFLLFPFLFLFLLALKRSNL